MYQYEIVSNFLIDSFLVHIYCFAICQWEVWNQNLELRTNFSRISIGIDIARNGPITNILKLLVMSVLHIYLGNNDKLDIDNDK